MGVLEFLGLGGGNEQVPGLEAWMANIGQTTNPAFQQLMSQLGTQSGIPNLPSDVYQQLQGQYDRTMGMGTNLLEQKFQELIGGNVAHSARLGQLGSTGHARAVSGTTRGYQNELAGLHTGAANQMNEAILKLRQMMYGGELQKMGFNANMIPQLLGIQGQGFGYQVQQNKVNQKGQQNLIDSLLGIGAAIPGGIGALSGLFGGGNNEGTDDTHGQYWNLLGGN